MKNIIIMILAGVTTLAHAGLVTLNTEAKNGTNGSAELSIGPYEVAELLSFPYSINIASSYLYVVKDGVTNTYSVIWGGSAPPFDPLVVAGPATIRLSSTRSGLATFRISPEPFPPDRTVIALPGTNQTTVALECSTNLVDWAAATNGIYGPMPEAKFFRIKLQRQ